MAEILEVYNHLDSAFVNLASEIFYKSRNRTLGNDYYMPWMSCALTNEIINIILRIDQKTIGGLVIIVQPTHQHNRHYKIGLVGLVCIDEASRGQGYFKKLMNKLCLVASSVELDLLTLWTSQHHLYEPFGFSVKDPLVSVLIHSYADYRKKMIPYYTDDEYNYMSAPGSSLSCQKISFGTNSITVVNYENRQILVKWSGSVDDVFGFAMSYFPNEVTLILPSDDELIKICTKNNTTMSFRHLDQQMWALVNDKLMPIKADIINHFKFLMLDRI